MRTIACLAVAAAVAVGANAASSARSTPSEMTWTDTGRDGGLITFTAEPPLCPSGIVHDVGGLVGIKMVHTCADGSGTFEFETAGLGRLHFNEAGTGRYASLRGTGSCSVTQNDDGSFTRPCHALADFDNTAPSARITNVEVLIPKPSGFSRVGAKLTTRDDVEGNEVSYRFSVIAAGRVLGHTNGATSGAAVNASVRVRLPKHARRLTLSLKVSDPLHNARTVTRSRRVRH